MVRVIVLCISAFMVSSVLPAEEKADDSGKWTADDIIMVDRASSFEISPDAEWVVWVKSRPDKKKDGTISDLMLSSLTGELEIRLTRSDDNDSQPKWRPDGKMIAFLSNRKGDENAKGSQIWLINPGGGEPWQLSKLPNGLRGYAWIDDKSILILAREVESLREAELKKKKDDSLIVEGWEDFHPTRLFRLDVESGELHRLTDNSLPISSFELSHNGRYVVTRHETGPANPSADPRNKPRYWLHDLEKRQSTEIFPDPLFYPGGFRWAADDSGFYFRRLHTSDYVNNGAGPSFLYWFELKTMEYSQVDLDHGNGLGRSFAITPDGFITSLASGTRFTFARYTRSGGGWRKALIDADDVDHLIDMDVAKDGKTALSIFSWSDKPPRYYVGELTGKSLNNKREFTKLNTKLAGKTFSRYEVVKWPGSLDETVEGILYYPHDYQEGRKYPLVLMIHGGPQGYDTIHYRESWSAYPNLMAGKGAFVLRPNYHGSGNYGQKWAESIRENYYDLEVPEIIAGVDALIEKGLVDENKLGVMGWSNGAILAIEVVLRDSRFKVCSFGAGDVNWTSDYGNCAFGPAFDNYYFGGAPWEVPEEYIKKSPLFRLHTLKTPVIIFHGERDTSVPTEQGWQAYRALQLSGKAPVRFLFFPGEPHGLRKLTHQRRKMEEELIWFDKYLFESYSEPNVAMKKGSPLELALQRKKASIGMVDGNYGVVHGDFLLPETVEMEEISVGRFEVTRAQFAQFDADYSYDPEHANFPVTGIGYERARDYCRWLSAQTGRPYRLPGEAEMEKLLKKAKSNLSNENRLDYWAGYKLNPEDAAALQQKVKELGEDGLLLRVGSMKPLGEELLFDIGGNAAEWCATEKGDGKTLGGAAIQALDDRSGYSPPEGSYIGFRVVLEDKD